MAINQDTIDQRLTALRIAQAMHSHSRCPEVGAVIYAAERIVGYLKVSGETAGEHRAHEFFRNERERYEQQRRNSGTSA